MSNNKYTRQNSNFFARIDWILVILILMLAAISVVSISSAMTSGQYGTDFSTRQIAFYGLGFVLASPFVPFKFIKKLYWAFIFFGVLSLVIYISHRCHRDSNYKRR
nr:hypothetical protein [Jeotgalicoccus sp. WY2]